MPPLDHLVWYRATTLSERLAAGQLSHAKEPRTEDDLTRFRLQSWMSQPPFDDKAYLAKRLALDHVTETQWRHVLGESTEALQRRFAQPPMWLSGLVDVLSRPSNLNVQTLLADDLKNKPTSGVLRVAAPFIEHALRRFDAGIAELTTKAVPFDPTTIKKIFFAHLPETLLAMMNRTVALELNIARLSGALEGSTPEARFQNFLARFDHYEHAQSFWQEYPVLARQLYEQAQRWVNVSLEFLARLCCDWEEIKATFTPHENPGALVAVKGDLADTHRGGQSVFIAKFSSGFHLVYKPKSLSVDAHFQQLLQWLNERGATPPFPTLTVLPCASYGWVEFVNARECTSTAEVQRFYRRQGGYLALLYLLDATDFHAGNLIACGEFPFLIDLEALFHPHRNSTGEVASACELARRALAHSVLRSGLLPERVWSNSENDGVDTSGLGTVDDQITPHALPHWEDSGTDTMHLTRKRKQIYADKNRPCLAGSSVHVLDYRDEILAGFAATYSLLRAHRHELLAEDGPLLRFAEDEVCVFLRSMRTYRRLLRESFHPDVLRDALDRDRLFDLLWVEVKDDPDLIKVLQVERDDLLRNDIPLFTTRPATRDLWINANERLVDFFAEPSLSIVQRRVQQFGTADYERQEWFIRASFATLPMKVEQQPAARDFVPPTEMKREELHAAARAIGDRLEELALRGADDAAWLGLMREPGRAWFIEVLGFDLDAGLPGVALFLAQLGARTGQKGYSALAQAVLTTMQQQIAERFDEVTMIGAFDGWGGVIYALTQLGVLWQRPDLLTEAETIAARLSALIAEDDDLDVYGGAAGCIGALRGLANFVASDHITTAAIQCGDHLLAQCVAEKPTGFMHGTAGIAWSLLLLHRWTGLERFRAAAQAILRDERSCPVATIDDCLAQINLLPHTDNSAQCAAIATTLAAMTQQASMQNHSLWDGAAGSLELLLQASRTEPEWEWHIRQQTAALLASIAESGWRCGTPLSVETPGLLAGLAGIGYELLRVAEPDSVPSVLTLEPPAMATGKLTERRQRGAAES
ncbi:MAG TPA: type 2 lanthipeptide synthetase LanM family protein [Blastocatellia bacterium]|nr:type 2 lanthipeptide synthetase LanM family protein [Blastocatellia bacterium]